MNPSEITRQRARRWRNLPYSIASRNIVWGNHAASQPDDCILGGMIADWVQQDPKIAGLFSTIPRITQFSGVEGFSDGSARLIVKTDNSENAILIEAYGHFIETLPEDGEDEVVFQVARVRHPSSGQQFAVSGGHHSISDWDTPNTTVWQEN